MSTEQSSASNEETINCVVGAISGRDNAQITCSIESPSSEIFGSFTSDHLASSASFLTVFLALVTTLYTI